MDELDEYELKLIDKAMKHYQQQLLAFPDCRDPDHPGCPKCWEEDEDETAVG